MSNANEHRTSNPKASYTVEDVRESARGWVGHSTTDTAIGEEILAHRALWACDEIERLTAELADANANYHRWHKAYMDYRYGGDPPGSPPGRPADETSEAICAICGEHANEHLAIPHQFMPGGKAY